MTDQPKSDVVINPEGLRALAEKATPGPWKCAGCGSESVACERTCDCPTSCLYRRDGDRTASTWKAEKVGPWRIWFDPPPIPIRSMDWHYQHEETDLDCPAWMNGSCASRDDAIAEIIDGYEDRATALLDENERMREALVEARTTLSIVRTQIMVEIGRCADPSESRWEGVPDKLKERLDQIEAALSPTQPEEVK